jgi:hypothetical protein
MEALMLSIRNEDPEMAEAKVRAHLETQLAIAFGAGCRLAAIRVSCEHECCWDYDFVVLSPGESAPEGWTIFENHSGTAIGRTA